MGLSGPAAAQSERVIGLLVDDPTLNRAALVEELVQVNAADFEVRVPDDLVVTTNFDPGQVRAGLAQLLGDPRVDVIVAYGTLATHVASTWPAPLTTPVVAPFVVNLEAQGIAVTPGGGSGVRNLALVAAPDTLEADLRQLHTLAPFEHVAVWVYSPNLPAWPRLPRMSAVAELGFRATIVPVPAVDPASALAGLTGDVDAVYVTDLSALSAAVRTDLAAAVADRGLPSFTAQGEPDVQLGFLAGLDDGAYFDRTNRRTALVVQEILQGRPAADIAVSTPAPARRLTLNARTAAAVGASPAWTTWFSATLVGEQGANTEALALTDAVRATLAANPELQAARRAAVADGQDSARAVARWLPHVEARSEVAWVDPVLSDATLGLFPKSQWTAGVHGEQLLFSDRALADVGVQAKLSHQRDAELRRLEADIVHQVGLAWTATHRAEALITVRSTEVDEVATHLEVAQARLAVGSATDAEVARWDAELATSRRALVDARIRRRQARTALNRLQGKPLDSPVRLIPLDQDALPGLAGTRVVDLAGDPVSFHRLADALVDDALQRNPDVAAVDAALAAARGARGAARRAPFMPTLGAKGQVSANLQRSAFETGGPLDDLVPEYPDAAWQAGIGASLPLFEGGKKFADIREGNARVAELEYTRQHVVTAVEARIRVTLDSLNGSLANRRLAEQAADGAERNLEWAASAYARGSTEQLTVIEARRAAITGRLSQELATATFFAQLLDLQWAVGLQYGRADDGEWAAYITFLEDVLDG